MSAFNKVRYNLAPFNVEISGEVFLEGSASVNFGFSYAGATFYCRGNARAAFIADDLRIDKGRVFRGVATETFAEDVSVLGYCYLVASGAEVFVTDGINLSQIARPAGSASEAFEGTKLNLSQDAAITAGTALSLDTERLNLSQIVFLSSDTGEVFQATADIVSLTEHVCEFPGLTLRPGQVLVIDANAYNVLLDGENAIHLQKGDWLEDLNRNTQSIVISGTGATRLTAEILYTERYL